MMISSSDCASWPGRGETLISSSHNHRAQNVRSFGFFIQLRRWPSRFRSLPPPLPARIHQPEPRPRSVAPRHRPPPRHTTRTTRKEGNGGRRVPERLGMGGVVGGRPFESRWAAERRARAHQPERVIIRPKASRLQHTHSPLDRIEQENGTGGAQCSTPRAEHGGRSRTSEMCGFGEEGACRGLGRG